MKQPEPLDDILDGLIHRWEKKDLKKGKAVHAAWKAAAGDQAWEHTRPASFKKGALLVIVENSTWLYELTMEKQEIIRKFNENYKGRRKLADLRFRVGRTRED